MSNGATPGPEGSDWIDDLFRASAPGHTTAEVEAAFERLGAVALYFYRGAKSRGAVVEEAVAAAAAALLASGMRQV